MMTLGKLIKTLQWLESLVGPDVKLILWEDEGEKSQWGKYFEIIDRNLDYLKYQLKSNDTVSLEIIERKDDN